ncbi:MAG: glycosyltransferase family 39 protein [Anaerolineae bacterium]|nr:glycosyltransferase family 39 protein [Anaerolineae bacterium]
MRSPDKRTPKRLWTAAICLGLFLVALAVRTSDLRAFLTPDEQLWHERTVQFALGLLDGDWSRTFQSRHPGVTTMWTGTLGLAARYLLSEQRSIMSFRDFVASTPFSLDLVPYLRMPTALLSALLVPCSYLLARRLWNQSVALLGALLLTLDPFIIGHSRVFQQDALTTIGTTLSVLCLLVALRARRPWGLAIISGITGALAMLSKASAFFLIPFTVLAAIITGLSAKRPPKSGHTRRLGSITTIWMLTTSATWIVAWPAMWRKPLETVSTVIGLTIADPTRAQAAGNFFLSQPVRDPGPLFYPLAFIFRTTPLSLIGLAALIAALLLNRSAVTDPQELRGPGTWCALLFPLLFAAFITVAVKKFDRYLLPAFPLADYLAALGWWWLADLLARRVRVSQAKPVAMGAVIVLQAGMAFVHHPYYLTAYNPLAGGGRTAQQILFTGWGEGLERAAAYLNAKEGAEELRVAAWYNPRCFDHFFIGQSWDLGEFTNEQDLFNRGIDYAVLYANQVQRQLPNRDLVALFQTHEPEYIVRLKGVDYAWVYRLPSTYPWVQGVTFGERLHLEDCQIDSTEVKPGERITATLRWQAHEQAQRAYTVDLLMLSLADRTWAQTTGTLALTAEQTLSITYTLPILPGTPPGSYRLAVQVRDAESGQCLDPPSWTIARLDVPATIHSMAQQLDIGNPLEAELGESVRLLGYNLEGALSPGQTFQVTLFWEALRPMERDYTVFVQLLGPEGRIRAQWDSQPADGLYPTSRWRAGEIIRDRYDLSVAADTPPGKYRLVAGMYLLQTGERLTVTFRGQQLGDHIVLTDTLTVEAGP